MCSVYYHIYLCVCASIFIIYVCVRMIPYLNHFIITSVHINFSVKYITTLFG